MPRSPRTARDETPDRVLDAALDLFNTHGTAAVSTNTIARHAGISPGNLYYWFENKAEIVRALHGRYATEHLAAWGADGAAPTPGDLAGRIAAGAEVTARHAFLARELVALVHGDPGLAAEYRALRDTRLALFGSLAHAWRAAGLLGSAAGGPPTDADLAAVVEALWLVSESWYPFAALEGPPDPARGAALVAAVVRPWLRTTVASGARPEEGR